MTDCQKCAELKDKLQIAANWIYAQLHANSDCRSKSTDCPECKLNHVVLETIGR
jgi:hypothetical protein